MKEGTETALYNQGYMDGFDDAEKDKDEPDYWTRLEHQYAGMAMQGIFAGGHVYWSKEDIIEYAVTIAHALVEKMKEERK